MKIFTTDDFDGIWPVGTAAVIRAENEEEARKTLDAELARRKLDQTGEPYTLKELPKGPCVVILRDGNY